MMQIICTICSDFVSNAGNIYATKCGHLFHHRCLLEWIERSRTCPQCRSAIRKRDMFRIYPTFNSDANLQDIATLEREYLEARVDLQKVVDGTKQELEQMMSHYMEIHPSIMQIATLTENLKRAAQESEYNLEVTNRELEREKKQVVELREKLHAATETIDQLKQSLQQLAKNTLYDKGESDSAATSHDDDGDDVEPRAKRARAGPAGETGDNTSFDLCMSTPLTPLTLIAMKAFMRVAAAHANVAKSQVSFQVETCDAPAAIEFVQKFARIKEAGKLETELVRRAAHAQSTAPPHRAPKGILGHRVKQFKSALQELFRAERASCLSVSQMSAYVNRKYPQQMFDDWEVRAALRKLENENVVIVAPVVDDKILLI